MGAESCRGWREYFGEDGGREALPPCTHRQRDFIPLESRFCIRFADARGGACGRLHVAQSGPRTENETSSRHNKASLVKGRWHGEAVTEGF